MVNVVGGGDLGRKLNLNSLRSTLSGESVRYEPEHWPGLYLKIYQESPAIFIFSSGKYNIAGADSIEHLLEYNSQFLSRLENSNIKFSKPDFEVRNLVLLDEFSSELDLENLAIGIGLELVEYDPEQFPGLVYRPSNFSGTFIIFRTGKILQTGTHNLGEAERGYSELFNKLTTILN